jgi:SPP1 gp7 family putative phage head morphogenesis protein
VATYQIPPLGPGWQLTALVARYRFAKHLEREVVAILEDAFRAVAERLRTMDVLSRAERHLLEDRLLEIRALLAEAYGEARAAITPALRDYAQLEAEIAQRQLAAMDRVRLLVRGQLPPTLPGQIATTIGAGQGVNVVVDALPRQLVVSSARYLEIVESIDVGGVSFGPWWSQAVDDSMRRVRRVVQSGIVQGQHPTEIARHIWETGTTRTPGLNAWRQSRTVAETTARTVVAAIQTDAQLAAESQFPQALHGYVLRAVLDARTSEICRGLADTQWRAGDPLMPRPPLHPNCRSVLEPMVNVPGIARSVSQHPSYEAWLRTQPFNVQRLVLGAGIAEHWNGGQADLAGTISVDRKPMTLAQLRRVLTAVQPVSYVAWIEGLPPTAQRRVLGPALARRVQRGEASVAEVLGAVQPLAI